MAPRVRINVKNRKKTVAKEPELNLVKSMDGQLWVEKYRPRTLDEMVGNDGRVALLKLIAAEGGNMPNLILTGKAGTGKTSSIYALARTIIGDHPPKDCILELNASDDRGIEVVREKIKHFAKKMSGLPLGKHKIIILDEADSMTAAAQQALRRIIELYSRTTRFAFSCNESTKLIEAIQSRCTILRYGRIRDHQIRSRLEVIAKAENLEILLDEVDSDEETEDENAEEDVRPRDGLDSIVEVSDGDMRKAVSNLQTISCFGKISSINVYRICSLPSPVTVANMIECCLDGDRVGSTEYMSEMLYSAFSSFDILNSMFRYIKDSETIKENLRIKYIREIGETSRRVSDGSTVQLQLEALLVRLIILADEFFENHPELLAEK